MDGVEDVLSVEKNMQGVWLPGSRSVYICEHMGQRHTVT